MPFSITRWTSAAHDPLDGPCREALLPYQEAGQTEAGETIYGPFGDIPAGEYECRRPWTTIELAQNWIDNIESISVPLGFNPISKSVTP
jgi:hypothetical protein